MTADPPSADPRLVRQLRISRTVERTWGLVERGRRIQESASQTLQYSAALIARHQRRSQLPHTTASRHNGVVHDSPDELSEQAEIDAEMAASLALIAALQRTRPHQHPAPSPTVEPASRTRPADIAEQRLTQIRRQLDQRQQELDTRQRELDRREALLDQREIEQNLAEWPPPAPVDLSPDSDA